MRPLKHSLLLGAVLCALPFYAGASLMRPAVGKPLLQAEALIQKQQYRAALLKVQQASAVPGLSQSESLAIAQLRGTAAAGAGDYPTAAASYETVLASNTEPVSTNLQLIQAIAGFYDEAGDTAHTIIWSNRYIAAGGTDPRTRALLAQSYYQTGDYAAAEISLRHEQDVSRRNGGALPEPELQLLAAAAQKSGDQAGYESALELLLQNDPRPEYWNAAISQLAARADFPDSLTLDLYRLRRATATLTAAADYEDYTERAILAGHIQEANLVIGQGFAAGTLTAATDSGHAERLKTLAATGAKAPAAPPSNIADNLDAGIAAYDAVAYGNAATYFEKAEIEPGITSNQPKAILARLWLIRVQNATAKK